MPHWPNVPQHPFHHHSWLMNDTDIHTPLEQQSIHGGLKTLVCIQAELYQIK